MRTFEDSREELIYLAELNDGKLNPHDVVNFASNPETHLHSKFTWDDTKAAQEYRLWQARKIISLEFEIIHSDSKEVGETRLFVSLTEDRRPEGGYRLISKVLTDDELRDNLLRDVLSELIRIKAKYKNIKELAGVFGEIDKLQLTLQMEKETV